jgi:hypothetical protein
MESDALQLRLGQELRPEHPLRAMQPLVVGTNEVNDEVLVELRERTTAAYALVELTWDNEQAFEELPATLFFASAEEASRHMARDADHHS